MKLQGRNLSIRLRGDDVKLLHTELRQIGLSVARAEADDAMFGSTTEAVVKAFQAQHSLPQTGIVDAATATAINREVDRVAAAAAQPPLAVHGRVVADDGTAASAVTVRAFDKDMRSETLLGSATTDRLGRYEIRYEPAQFRRAEKESADLVVRAVKPGAAGAADEVLAASDVLFNAGRDVTIDLTIDLAASRPSEFEQYVAAVTPLAEAVALAQLTEDDIGFLAGETGIDRVHLAFLATAHQHAAATRIASEAYYAVFRQGLPSALSALLLQTPADLKQALVAALDAHIVPAGLRTEIDAIVAAFKRLRSERLVRGSEADAIPTRILAAAGLSADQQDTVLDLWFKRDSDAGFWTALRASPLAAQARPLQAALDVALLAGNNAPLTEALARSNVRSVQALAALSDDDLRKLIVASPEILASIEPSGDSETDVAKAARLAAGVLGLARTRHPTAFVMAARRKSDRPLDRDVARVLENAPELDLRDADLARFLADNPRVLDGVADAGGTQTELRRVQRVLRIAPEAAHTHALMEAGLDSAHAVAGMSATAFAAKFGDALGGGAQARIYHARAQRVNDTVLAIAGAAQQAASALRPSVLAVLPDAAQEFPNLATLFGAQDLCACRHCRSVLSPAAYLVDLLQFINPKHGAKPITRLRARRPDIEHIPLSCENTNTPLPYIDLANEILEFYVANGALTAAVAHDTDGATAEQLAVTPQFVLDAAYQRLATAVFPAPLPFQRPLAIVRRYLQQLGAGRAEVMQAFAASESDVDLESIGIAGVERDILVGASAAPLRDHYGLPADPTGTATMSAAALMKALGASYDELLSLLKTGHLAAGQGVTLTDTDQPPRCNPEKMAVGNLTAAFWQRAHRFVRLQRKLGIAIAELDDMLQTLGGGDIDVALLRRVAQAEGLRGRLGLARKVLLGFWKAAASPDEGQHRRTVLARAMRLGEADFDALLALSAIQPFAPGDPAGLVALEALLKMVRDSGLTVAQLAYVYRPGDPTAAAAALPNSVILQLIRALRTALQALAQEAADGTLDAAALDARRRDVAVQVIAEGLALPAETARLLMEGVVRSASDPALFLMSDVLGVAALAEDVLADLSAAVLQPARRGLVKLHKAALLIDTLGLSVRETAHITAHPADFAGFSFDGIPVDAADANGGAFAAWQQLARFATLSARLPQRAKTLIDVFEAAALATDADPRAAALAALQMATQWDEADLAFLAGPAGHDLAAPQDFRDIASLRRLERAVVLARRLDVPAARLATWANPAPDAALAADVVAALQARNEPDSWVVVGKEARDTLREAQRDALVAHILNHDPGVRARGITTADGLFEYFLIDTQMAACMDTSRIKQAISSVQLFIQRALMGLEDGVAPNDIDAAQWHWMRNYRVWEANRKVFLFPENWIEPDLRDDKTPFFRKLESRLLQDDISFDTAEAAVERYLEQLHSVARLDIRALYVEEPQDDGDEEIVHIFGRTLSSPQAYYYRRLIGDRTWTPWEKIEAGIEGDHLLPLVANRRLYLFWLHIEERQDAGRELPASFIQSMEHWLWKTQLYPKWQADRKEWLRQHTIYQVWNALESALRAANIDFTQAKADYFANAGLPEQEEPEPRAPEEPPFSSPPELSHLEISLAWSEYRNGAWSTKQSASAPVSSRPVMPTLQAHFGKQGFGGALVLGLMNDAFDFVPIRADGMMVETIFTVYLPNAHEHYLTGSVDEETGRLSIRVSRRYEHQAPLLDFGSLTIQGHEHVGEFQVTCGNLAEPSNDMDLMVVMAFDQLPRPNETVNDAQAFAHAGTPGSKWLGMLNGQAAAKKHQLAVSADGETRVILGSVPQSGAFAVLRDEQHASFSRKPPYQNFVFQDDHRAYLASPWGGTSLDNIAILPRLPVGELKKVQAPLVEAAAAKPKLVASASSPAMRLALPRAVARLGGIDGVSLQPVAAPTALLATARTFPALTKKASGTLLGHVSAAAVADLLNLKGLRFQSLVHPHVCAFKEALTKGGLPGLFDLSVQSLDGDPGAKNNAFARWYEPTSEVANPYPRENVDFGRSANALYNWELFFHVPMLIAEALTRNQRFEEAMHWFHFVFDPTTDRSGPSPERFWNCLPFFKNSDPERDSVQEMLMTLAGKKPGWRDFADQIEEWRANPFNPHLIARLRIAAYQKSVVMKYIDNLIAWGDQLFRRDTIEEINQATLLYVLAGEILGPRPRAVPPTKEVATKTYSQLAGDLDAFSNALVEAEQFVPYSNKVAPQKQLAGRGRLSLPAQSKSPKPPAPPSLATVTGLYFCPPQNDELLARWDTVADRLFKIRHCMNIEGVARDLPLFEPPIDPALLVRATAAGIDLGSVLDDLYSGLPQHRFAVLAQKASELCGEARALGAALLVALEKRDAEALTLLRSEHERSVLGLMEQVRIAQCDEAVRNREALAASRETVLARYRHCQAMLGRQSDGDMRETSLPGQARMGDGLGVPMIEHELSELASLDEANDIQRNAAGFEIAANVAHIIGDVAAAPWGVGVNISIGSALTAFASYYRMQAANLNYDATLAAKLGQAVMRAADYVNQSNQAVHESRAIDKQIVAADVRIAICNAELANHRQQMENARQVEDVLRDRFTSTTLYNWMVSQTSSLYFQAYQLAYDMARRTERAWRHEIGAGVSSFIRPGYWESLRKGLLAADRLHHDLKRMEAAYIEQNRREHELTKHVPLTQLDALAFVALKETGACIIRLPEALFDMDHPGHYFRRLKSVSLSIPCVAGAYTSVNATLTLLKGEIRVDANAQGAYPKDENADDPRFRTSFAAAQSIATSHAQNDSGLFELNFRDDRYLPFEGAGAISEWRLALPKDCNALDFDTISDVILHVKYTARDGGAALAQKARDATLNIPSQEGLHRLFSVRNEFSNDWYRFLHIAEPATQHRLVLDIGRERFPFVLRNKTITIQKLTLYLKAHDSVDTSSAALDFSIGRGDPADPNAPVLPLGGGNASFTPLGGSWGNLLSCQVGGLALAVPGSLVLEVAASDLTSLTQGQNLVDLMIVAEYSAANS
ncbi:MAG: peptidoglycan-binding protein [Rhodospirillales bacterium]|nr:peptidoglycan-binding protein [Rhodospirillales bacterium]